MKIMVSKMPSGNGEDCVFRNNCGCILQSYQGFENTFCVSKCKLDPSIPRDGSTSCATECPYLVEFSKMHIER